MCSYSGHNCGITSVHLAWHLAHSRCLIYIYEWVEGQKENGEEGREGRTCYICHVHGPKVHMSVMNVLGGFERELENRALNCMYPVIKQITKIYCFLSLLLKHPDFNFSS